MPLVTSFGYDDSLQPWLYIDCGNHVPLAKNACIALGFSGEKYCIGCGKEIIRGRQCSDCEQKDEWNACLKCDGSVCLAGEAQRKTCLEGEYSVYLTAFGEFVKAGISRTDRLQKRWFEQGADYAVEIARGLNGRTSRQAEALLHDAGLLGWLSNKDKIKLLAAEKNSAALENKIGGVKKIISQTDAKVIDGEITSFDYEILGDAAETKDLNGKIKGWKGGLLFLENDGPKVFSSTNAVARKTVANRWTAFI
ncbi:MAG: DUF2797 domain-containing protein [Candidatus Micrarchaeota archaeon]